MTGRPTSILSHAVFPPRGRNRRSVHGGGPLARSAAIASGMSDDIHRTSDSTAPAPNGDEPRSRRMRWVIIALVLLLALYIASPYYAFWRFTAALRARDAEQLQSWVDFPALRKSMKKQINAKMASLRPQNPKRQKLFDTLSDAFGSQVVDSLVDAYLTPEGLAAFLANPKVPGEAQSAETAGVTPSTDAAPADAPLIAPETNAPPGFGHRIDWSRVRYAFFTGSRDFLVDVDGTKLRFRFTGLRWKLRGLELDLEKVKM